MLDVDTKRRIDTARDILVGKVPDPKSQVEQITIALIYKFMNDMDTESEELGGQRKFFAGDFERYSWPKLLRSGLGGYDTLNLYAEAIARMPENPGIPLLFRDIFKNAYLPYHDPETLKSFLKVIDEFKYDHSERLGDAFEYLLSVLGSQGEAGQFRTPRHIIDFIVSIVDPKKNESILDPACGTAGFLISAYKHIVKANTDKGGHVTLTPDEKGKIAQRLKGYDISPDMVRLSLVNLYLHGFTDPHIEEYDTLTSEEKWNELADVILANPPFMSPKGGIKPHKRFSVQSKRSEVLFVDYIAEHLSPTGRAGVIVPEGIIFQSGGAYKELRRMLVENYLVAVISLPAGVFNPYSGVKTSILILDKTLAKHSDSIGFFKIENDGYGLGAQRREAEKNDLPQCLREIKTYLKALQDHVATDAMSVSCGQHISKVRIQESGEFNLTGERYRESGDLMSAYRFVRLEDICEINPETGEPQEIFASADFNYIDISCVENESGRVLGANRVLTTEAPSRARRLVKQDDILLSTVRPNLKAFAILKDPPERAIASTGFAVLRAHIDKVVPGFLIWMIRNESAVSQMVSMMGKGSYPSINQTDVESIQIPLPPLDIQKEIVAEIESYQKVIDGARAVVENYKPRIPIDPDWPMERLQELCTIVRGSSPRPQGDARYFGGPVPRLMVADITRDGMYATPKIDSLTELGAEKSRPMKKGEVVVTVSGNPGLPTILAVDACIHDGFAGLRDLQIARILPQFLYYYLLVSHEQHSSQSVGAVFRNLTTDQIREFNIPLPSVDVQRRIVAEITAEQNLVTANKDLIARFEKKIQATIARVWGEERKEF